MEDQKPPICKRCEKEIAQYNGRQYFIDSRKGQEEAYHIGSCPGPEIIKELRY